MAPHIYQSGWCLDIHNPEIRCESGRIFSAWSLFGGAAVHAPAVGSNQTGSPVNVMTSRPTERGYCRARCA
jgi:hypothetical protein